MSEMTIAFLKNGPKVGEQKMAKSEQDGMMSGRFDWLVKLKINALASRLTTSTPKVGFYVCSVYPPNM